MVAQFSVGANSPESLKAQGFADAGSTIATEPAAVAERLGQARLNGLAAQGAR